MLSISTAYNIDSHKKWQGLLAEVNNLGFDTVELNVQIPENSFPEIDKSLSKQEIIISSLHNFCPRLENLPDNKTISPGYSLTSPDEEERKLAVQLTCKTIDFANQTAAKAVVVHCGEVETEPSGREFFQYIQTFGIENRIYLQYKNAIWQDRNKKSSSYMEILFKSLDEVLTYASSRNVTICLENRFFVHEIPNIEETLILLEKFNGAPIAYWHDTGHAEISVRLGFVKNHVDYLKALHHKMFGMHLHDVRGLSDHFAPGSGELDFSIFKSYVKNDTIKVVEAHSRATAKEVHKSIEYLNNNM